MTWFERERDQQSAQPGARHVGQPAIVRANLERPQYPDLHVADFAMRRRWLRAVSEACQAGVRLLGQRGHHRNHHERKSDETLPQGLPMERDAGPFDPPRAITAAARRPARSAR